jgi:hypothetical protein
MKGGGVCHVDEWLRKHLAEGAIAYHQDTVNKGSHMIRER